MTEQQSTDGIDYYGTNPHADSERQWDPARYDAIASVTPPPKAFQNGTADVPAFTVSGLDPQLLLKLPYGVRHAVAAEPDISRVHEIFEEYSDEPTATIDHPGFTQHKNRVEKWMRTARDPRSDAQREADEEALYQRFAKSRGWDTRTPAEKAKDTADHFARIREAEENLKRARSGR